MKLQRNRTFATVLGLIVALAMFAVPSASAATGDYVGTVTFSQDCTSGIGVGIAFDGQNLWYSCYDDSGSGGNDLYRADPLTGVVSASYNIVPNGGLGALSYDATRNVIWAGSGGGGNSGDVWEISLDASENVTGAAVAFNVSSTVGPCTLDDGLAFDANNVGDPTDDVIYYSDDCSSGDLGGPQVYVFDLGGTPLGNFPWGGSSGYLSGLAVGGQLLYEGSDGASHVWVVDKTTQAAAFDFPTNVIASDPNFRDEDLECDTNTFAVDVMWSKEAYSPMRAHAFEIPAGTCGIGGVPESTPGRMTGGGSVFTSEGVRVTHGFELHCDGSSPNSLEVNWGMGNRFHLDSLDGPAACTDDPAISEGQPVAGFDTISGAGVGSYNGEPGATIQFTFTDAGEPGNGADSAQMTIWDAGGTQVLQVSGLLKSGNQQAHPK